MEENRSRASWLRTRIGADFLWNLSDRPSACKTNPFAKEPRIPRSRTITIKTLSCSDSTVVTCGSTVPDTFEMFMPDDVVWFDWIKNIISLVWSWLTVETSPWFENCLSPESSPTMAMMERCRLSIFSLHNLQKIQDFTVACLWETLLCILYSVFRSEESSDKSLDSWDLFYIITKN